MDAECGVWDYSACGMCRACSSLRARSALIPYSASISRSAFRIPNGFDSTHARGSSSIGAMLSYIWFGLMASALAVAAVRGTADEVTKGAVESASAAVQVALGLIGIMTLWLGMMRVAEAAGLVTLLGRALRPIIRLLFPEVPSDHPAAGALVLAVAANMLGLNNAATPLGIKAMEELQSLNPDKDSASNPMVTFMAVTTSGVQLIPATMIGILAAAGSKQPTAIIGASIIATFMGTVAAVVAAKVLQRLYGQRAPIDVAEGQR